MIAKINRSSNLYGVVKYNRDKVVAKKAEVLYTNKIIENGSSSFSMNDLMRSFEPYLIANQKTEKHTIHISLNPDPRDVLSNNTYILITQEYMQKMGFGDQPYIVFKHMDIDRTHLHIVTIGVDEHGKKISDTYEKMRSAKLCRSLEKEFALVVATDKSTHQNNDIFRPVNYLNGDVKSQIASVVRHIPTYYRYQTLGEYNALLSLFNVVAEKVEIVSGDKKRNGLVYIALNANGEKVSSPIKASLFGKKAGLESLEAHFVRSRETSKSNADRERIKNTIENAITYNSDELQFKRRLKEAGINAVIRRNNEGRIYGITFIDHNSRTVWNGSRLGKDFSANFFHALWNDTTEKIKDHEPAATHTKFKQEEATGQPTTHPLFDFWDRDNNTVDNFIEDIGSFLPISPAEDYEELAFETEMKKRKKRRKK